MDKPLRRVEFTIDPDNPFSGVKTISLVDEPAIESNFMVFSKQKKETKYIMLEKHKDDDKKFKQIVAGLALIPNKDILRIDDEGEAYSGYFTAQTIEMIRDKFQKELMNNNVNMMHLEDQYVDAYMVESFIIDSEERLADVKNKGIEDAVLGAWFVSYKIEDAEVFELVKEGRLKGFSVEAYLDKVFSKINNKQNKKFTKMNKFVEKLKALVEEFDKEDTKKEDFVVDIIPELEAEVEHEGVGSVPRLVESGDVAPDGSYILEDGRTVVIEGGLVTEIVAPEAAPDEAEEAKKDEMEDKDKMESEDENLSKLKEDFEALKAEVKELKKENEDLKAKADKFKKEANEAKVKLSATPANKPITKKDTKKEEEKVDFSKLSTYERIARKNGLPVV